MIQAGHRWTLLKMQALDQGYLRGVRCCHLFGLVEQRWCCGPVWKFADWIHFRSARFKALC